MIPQLTLLAFLSFLLAGIGVAAPLSSKPVSFAPRPGAWGPVLAACREEEVVVSMPRMKISSEWDLKDALEELGMKDAFDAAKAKLGGLADGQLRVSEVKQKVVAEIDEKGTKMAAATSVGVVLESMRMPIQFKADRPFLVIIRDNVTGAILAMGSVDDPS